MGRARSYYDPGAKPYARKPVDLTKPVTKEEALMANAGNSRQARRALERQLKKAEKKRG
jgi:hypothetical protein